MKNNDKKYADEQLQLGNVFYDEGNLEQARIHWNNISNKETTEKQYAWAQFRLGNSKTIYDVQQARIHWSNISNKETTQWQYAEAQRNLENASSDILD